jgi:hypothetical protein
MAAEQAFLDAFIHNFSELFVFKSRRKALVAALGPVLSNAAGGQLFQLRLRPCGSSGISALAYFPFPVALCNRFPHRVCHLAHFLGTFPLELAGSLYFQSTHFGF